MFDNIINVLKCIKHKNISKFVRHRSGEIRNTMMTQATNTTVTFEELHWCNYSENPENIFLHLTHWEWLDLFNAWYGMISACKVSSKVKNRLAKSTYSVKTKQKTTRTKVVLKASKISQKRKVVDSVFSQVAGQMTTTLLKTNSATNHGETLEVPKKKFFRASLNGFLWNSITLLLTCPYSCWHYFQIRTND